MPKTRSAFAVSVLVLLMLQVTGARAKGGTFRFEHRHNPEHITSLPPEVRQIVVSKCSEPRASHDFSNYRDGTAEIDLRYEHLLCGLSHLHCTSNGCLHQVYGRSGQGTYRLIRSFYVGQPEVAHY
jgi:hypothetical protein